MDPTEHRPRPECQQSRRLVEPTARRRAARRQPVEAISCRTRRIIVAVSALAIAVWPSLVFAALVLQGTTGGFLGPAIAAISLGLVGHSALAERLGRNQRFAATGAVMTAELMGAIGYFLSYQAIFLASAALALPLLVALARIRLTDIHFGRACGQPDHDTPTPPPRARRLSLWKNHNLLTFAACLFLFQLANASMLPLAGEELAYRHGTDSSLIISVTSASVVRTAQHRPPKRKTPSIHRSRRSFKSREWPRAMSAVRFL